MIVAVSDTHRTEGHGLRGRTLDAVRAAECVLHAGDFTTGAVLDAFHDEADRLAAVHGNSDSSAVRDRLPARRVAEAGGLRVVLVHGHDHAVTALALLGRQEAADLVVYGHTHRPSVADAGDVALVNPGSHAQPRGSRPAHAELDRVDGEVRVRLVEPDGTVFEEFAT